MKRRKPTPPPRDPERPFRLGLVTACWTYGAPARARTEEMVLHHTAALDVPGAELVRVAAWSPDDPLSGRLITVPGWRFVRAPNHPISDKWNAAARALRAFDVDAMMIFGSDDFLNAAFIRAAIDRIRAGAAYVMPKSCYFYDVGLREAIYCRVIGRVGGGRTLARRVLDAVQFRPWEPGANRGIDGAMDRRLRAVLGEEKPDATIDDIAEIGGLLLDIKSGEGLNMQPYDRMKRGLQGEVVDAAALLRRHVPAYADELLRGRL